MASRPVRIAVDSAADIPSEIAHTLDITIIPLLVHMEGATYRDGIDLTGEDFYRRLRESKSVTTTSLPTLDALSEAYRQLTYAGNDVLSIHLSSKLSGTFNAALMASTTDGVTPEAVEVLDSRTLSMAQGWIAIRAAEYAREGHSLADVTEYADSLLSRTRLFGVVDSLEHIMRSGRVGRIPGTVGSLLSIKPILTVRPNGEALIQERIRTRTKALERIVELVGGLGELEGLAVLHGADEEGAMRLTEMLATAGLLEPEMISHIGAVLGTHLGPCAVGVCCLTKN